MSSNIKGKFSSYMLFLKYFYESKRPLKFVHHERVLIQTFSSNYQAYMTNPNDVEHTFKSHIGTIEHLFFSYDRYKS
jgi:hypothetical protein